MTIQLDEKELYKAIERLGFIRLFNPDSDKRQYRLPMKQGELYPRYHLIVRKVVMTKYRLVDIHIDWEPHTNSESEHPLINQLIESIKQQ